MSLPEPFTHLVDETTLVFAFRYALGRRSTAPYHMVAILLREWDNLEEWTREQIVREIEVALRRGDAGDGCDREQWQRVLDRARGTSLSSLT